MSDIGIRTWVKCIKDAWVPSPCCRSAEGPSLGSVWQVCWIREKRLFGGARKTFIGLAGWPEPDACFALECFIPLTGDAEIERLRASISAPAKELVD
jgi:hypothetical protein